MLKVFNKFSMDNRIQTGFSGSNGFSGSSRVWMFCFFTFFGSGLVGFHWMFGHLVLLDAGFVGFRWMFGRLVFCWIGFSWFLKDWNSFGFSDIECGSCCFF
jgi:hypothetical protein